MRLSVTLAVLAAASAVGGAQAQTSESGAAAPPPVPPRVFQAAGYAEPDITPGLCKTIDAQHTQCVIPEMTAGRYLIQATGTSTATADDAVQRLAIQAGDSPCPTATRRGTAQTPWKVGQAQTLRFDCAVTVLTDHPLTVTVVYADYHANKDPKGPTLSLRRLSWGGIVTTIGVQPQQ